MFGFSGESILDVFRGQQNIKEDKEVFGDGSVSLSKQNMVYFTQLDGFIPKCVPYNLFRDTAYYYSEYMTTPCADLLAEMEAVACMNSKENEIANQNYSRT